MKHLLSFTLSYMMNAIQSNIKPVYVALNHNLFLLFIEKCDYIFFNTPVYEIGTEMPF